MAVLKRLTPVCACSRYKLNAARFRLATAISAGRLNTHEGASPVVLLGLRPPLIYLPGFTGPQLAIQENSLRTDKRTNQAETVPWDARRQHLAVA
jgi:hypothetical protein